MRALLRRRPFSPGRRRHLHRPLSRWHAIRSSAPAVHPVGRRFHRHLARSPRGLALQPRTHLRRSLRGRHAGAAGLLPCRRCMDVAVRQPRGWRPSSGGTASAKLISRIRRTLTGSQPARRVPSRNIAHHYDLNGRTLQRFFSIATGSIPAPTFARGDETLEAGAGCKEAPHRCQTSPRPSRICTCSISAAAGAAWRSPWRRTTAARVTGITLSAEQHAASIARAHEAGARRSCDRFKLQDYRHDRRPSLTVSSPSACLNM